ncbi:hypothetical protein [Vibrio sp. LaRot3]|uniref:hypothetical protein n=1 Tax=Vibrio sp. LaRot3 TaxID=2998829 RepID=UPI0022CDC941|nr:hypothetical protein [Vibrio sp. LaRot3]MDA0149884.1 hypothetical protein [Vibrio sp. LaRot3]
MKKGMLVATTVGFVVFVGVGSKLQWFGSSNAESFPKLPAEPGFVVSPEFDGEWAGKRVDVTNNNLCEKTTITGKVVDGFATFTLTYNGTPLRGWIDEAGSLRLYANNRMWDYRFTATASGNRIQGEWFLTNGPCKGSWHVDRVASVS